MTRQPVVLIHSGRHEDDLDVARMIGEVHPGLPVLTPATDDEVAELLPGAEILFAFYFPYHLLPLATSLRWFQVMGAGLERLAAAAETLPPGVQVTNLKGVFGGAMAEYALTHMLAHAQDLRGILRRQAAHEWREFTPRRLFGSTVGMIGLGSIGQEVVRRCQALGAHVIGLSRSGRPVPGVERVWPVSEIEAFLPECDYLVCVVPQTRETIGLLSRERLRLLKRTCFLVNMGRGTIADPDDLVVALREGWLAGAALDVFPTEPLPADHPLWSLENVVVTPHISGINRPEEVVRVFLDNFARYQAGRPLLYPVDLARGY